MSFQIWRPSWPCRNNRNPIVLDQYGEQFSIRHQKCMVHFGLFPFLALVISYSRANFWGKKHLIGGTWVHGVREWKRFPTDSSIASNFLLFSSSTCLLGTFPFFPNMVALVSIIFPFFIPSLILPTEYIKSLNSTKALTHVIIWRGQSVHEHGIFLSTGEGWSDH